MKILATFFCGILLLCLFSCDQEEVVYGQRRNNLIGVWNIESTAEYYQNGELVDNPPVFGNRLARLVLNADGVAIYTTFQTDTLEWYYQPDPPETVLLLEGIGSVSNISLARVFLVRENSAERHV